MQSYCIYTYTFTNNIHMDVIQVAEYNYHRKKKQRCRRSFWSHLRYWSNLYKFTGLVVPFRNRYGSKTAALPAIS